MHYSVITEEERIKKKKIRSKICAESIESLSWSNVAKTFEKALIQAHSEK